MNAHFNKAADLYREGRIDDAVKELKLAIDLDPEHVKSYVTLGTIYEARAQHEQAIEAYRKALQVDMDDPIANLRLCIILTNLKRYADALTPLRMAWSNDQKNAKAANALARALDESGDYDTAQIMYERVIKLDPDLTDARFNLGTLRFNEQKFESAITQFVTYMVKAGENSRAHRNIGKALVQLGQIDSAINSFNKALALDPSDATIYYNLALVYEGKGDHETAMANFHRALELNPNYIDARYIIAKALRANGQISEAMKHFHIVLQQSPDHHRALNGLANCYLIQHDYEAAADLFRQAITIQPGFAMAHYNLGIALQNMEQFDEALHCFKEAAHLDPTDRTAYQAIEQASAHLSHNFNQSQRLTDSTSFRLYETQAAA